jgi:hypothetical protein
LGYAARSGRQTRRNGLLCFLNNVQSGIVSTTVP